MTWYAELKRRKWYCINGVNMIQIYRKKLYDDWYNSLTEKQKQRLEEYEKKRQKKENEMQKWHLKGLDGYILL
jgi:hypothetical protein